MAVHQGQAHQNVLHFHKADAVTADAAALANDIKDNWCVIWKPGVGNNFIFQNIHVKQLGSIDPPYDLAVAIPGTGSAEGGTLAFVCMNIRLQTGIAGKHGRGRIYHAGLNPGHLSFGIIAPTFVSYYMTNIITPLFNRYGPTGPSEFTIGVRGRASGAEFHPATSMTLDTIPRVQRRRNLGVGI
jgi:hypothetical protein